MNSAAFIGDQRHFALTDSNRSFGQVGQLLGVAMEGLVLITVAVAPWAAGMMGTEFRYVAMALVAILLALWGLRTLIEWKGSWTNCPVAICLALMIGIGVFQLVPISPSMLGWISPGTASMYDRLLPDSAEVLRSGAGSDVPAAGTGSTISLYPDATRRALVDLIAVISLFVVVRNNMATIGALRRLSLVLLVNGALVSFVAIIKFVGGSNIGDEFWSYTVNGMSFGPFVNHNHFAFFMNPCIGLAAGLMLARGQHKHRPRNGGSTELGGGFHSFISDTLHDPVSLWMGSGIVLMLCGVALCLSRGGYIALIGAITASVLLMRMRTGRVWRLSALLTTMTASIVILAWFGSEVIESRVATMWNGDALSGARAYLLANAWRQIIDFPIWGTGYGTFQYVEPLKLHRPSEAGLFYMHAHNDYLEDLVEGGVVRFCIRLVAIGLIFRYACRAITNQTDPSVVAMAVGAFLAFTTIVIHSFFEFGLYHPAITVLATVLCAQICGLGDDRSIPDPRSLAKGGSQAAASTHKPSTNGSSSYGEQDRSFGSSAVFPLIGSFSAFFLGWFLFVEGSKAGAINELRKDARDVRRDAQEGKVDPAAEIFTLEQMVSIAPRNSEWRLRLGEAYLDFSKRRTVLRSKDGDKPDSTPDQYWLAGMHHILAARNLCPLLPESHARIAFYTDEMARSDPRELYIARAKQLAPADPQLWYVCGLQELEDGRPNDAWASWKRSLSLSDQHFQEILDRSALRLSPEQILTRVLPDDPDVLLEAALHLYPEPRAIAQRKPMLDKALALLTADMDPRNAIRLHIKGMVHAQLGQTAEAIASYQSALYHDVKQVDWRYELASLLHTHGQHEQARRELDIALAQSPGHGRARQLSELLAKEAASANVTNRGPARWEDMMRPTRNR